MKKRGVSPLIATVLIIGFTILLASFIFIWGVDLFKKYQEKTDSESMAKLECATKINFNINKACILGENVTLQIENTGSGDIDSFLFRVKGDNTNNLYELNRTSGVYSSGVYDAQFDANSLTGIINPNEINVFPRILIKDKKFTCDKKSISIKPCYLLSRLNTFDDWKLSGNGIANVITEDIKTSYNVDDGIYVALIETGKIEIKSNGFKIPNEVKNIHISGKTSDSGNIIYNLKLLDGTDALNIPLSVVNGNINPTREIPENLKGQDVYLSITINGNAGDYATLSELCYTNSNYCII